MLQAILTVTIRVGSGGRLLSIKAFRWFDSGSGFRGPVDTGVQLRLQILTRTRVVGVAFRIDKPCVMSILHYPFSS